VREKNVEETMEIENKVREIICQQLDVDPDMVKMETSFVDDLGADSLAVVELVLALEEAFEIDIPDEDTEKLRTFKDAVEYISAKASS
jgi:acyl carrier protein